MRSRLFSQDNKLQWLKKGRHDQDIKMWPIWTKTYLKEIIAISLKLRDFIVCHCIRTGGNLKTIHSEHELSVKHASPLRLRNSSWLKMCLDISTTCQEPWTHNSTLSIHTVHLKCCTCPSLHLLYICIGWTLEHTGGLHAVAQSCSHRHTKRRLRSVRLHGTTTGRQENVGQASKLWLLRVSNKLADLRQRICMNFSILVWDRYTSWCYYNVEHSTPLRPLLKCQPYSKQLLGKGLQNAFRIIIYFLQIHNFLRSF